MHALPCTDTLYRAVNEAFERAEAAQDALLERATHLVEWDDLSVDGTAQLSAEATKRGDRSATPGEDPRAHQGHAARAPCAARNSRYAIGVSASGVRPMRSRWVPMWSKTQVR